MRAIGVLAMFIISLTACGQKAVEPLAPDHPVLGRWTITTTDGACSETYRFRTDKTAFVTSCDEVAELRYELSSKVSAKGFYRWEYTIVTDNGKKDCSGKIMKAGDTATWFIQLDSSKEMLTVCLDESTAACLGPLRRLRGGDS
jgi:hypothetical protein